MVPVEDVESITTIIKKVGIKKFMKTLIAHIETDFPYETEIQLVPQVKDVKNLISLLLK